MQRDLENIRKVGQIIHKAKNIIAVGCVGSCGGGTLVVYQLSKHFDIKEIVAMGAILIAVSACGRYAFVRVKRAIRERRMSLSEFASMVMHLFSGAPDSAEEQFDWVALIGTTYKSGRRKYALPVGVDENGKLVEVPMRGSDCHLFVQGVTGFGKSVLMNQILIPAGLSGLYQISIIGRTMKDYKLMLGMNNVHSVRHQGNPDEYGNKLILALQSVYEEIVKRQSFLESKGKREMADVRADQRPQSILVVVDEFTNAAISLVDLNGRKAAAPLFGAATMIANEGRSVNIHLLLVGQRATSIIPLSLRSQMVNITYKTKNAEESKWATGSTGAGAENLIAGDPKKGEMSQILISGGRNNKLAFVPITSDQMLADAAKQDESAIGGEPHWLAGYQSPNRTTTPPVAPANVAIMEFFKPAYPLKIIESSPEVKDEVKAEIGAEIGAEIEAKAATGTAVESIESWAGQLFDTHTDFIDSPQWVNRQRVIKIALCKAIGLSGNETMRAVFDGRNDRYRKCVNEIWQHMDQAHVCSY